jgi:hypothetical protein
MTPRQQEAFMEIYARVFKAASFLDGLADLLAEFPETEWRALCKENTFIVWCSIQELLNILRAGQTKLQ